MKIGQLTEYNMKNIFVEKSYTNYARETISRPLSKISSLTISLDQYCKLLNNLFLLYANLLYAKGYQNIVKSSYRQQIKLCKKTKSELELVYLPHFLHNF